MFKSQNVIYIRVYIRANWILWISDFSWRLLILLNGIYDFFLTNNRNISTRQAL